MVYAKNGFILILGKYDVQTFCPLTDASKLLICVQRCQHISRLFQIITYNITQYIEVNMVLENREKLKLFSYFLAAFSKI